ncbi:MAG: hypothetical protein ACLP0J_12815 [Solirubrobacteraceae bacterium]
MTAASVSSLPIAAFGDLDAGFWGIVVDGTDPALATAVIGGQTEPPFAPATLERAAPDAPWTVAGAGHTLTIAQTQSPAATPGIGDTLELCRVQGAVALNGNEQALDCAGVRCSALENVDSLRLVVAWFPNDVALALLARRPPGANGQERDEIAVVLRGEGAPSTVFDPRLSTTYRGDGTPARMGIELWLGATQDGDLLSRRAAGEVAAPPAVLSRAGLRLEAHALRCQSSGTQGAGVYIIARPDR